MLRALIAGPTKATLDQGGSFTISSHHDKEEEKQNFDQFCTHSVDDHDDNHDDTRDYYRIVWSGPDWEEGSFSRSVWNVSKVKWGKSTMMMVMMKKKRKMIMIIILNI